MNPDTSPASRLVYRKLLAPLFTEEELETAVNKTAFDKLQLVCDLAKANPSVMLRSFSSAPVSVMLVHMSCEIASALQRSHDQLVANLVKPGQDILDSLTPQKCDLWHMGSCVGGEAGELFDAVKRFVIYEKEIDRDNVVEELGDIEFYLEGIRQNLGITREETLVDNQFKLRKRYDGAYSNAAAQLRADKQ